MKPQSYRTLKKSVGWPKYREWPHALSRNNPVLKNGLISINLKLIDSFERSPAKLFFVIPVKTGIHELQEVLDSRLRGSDGCRDFLRGHN